MNLKDYIRSIPDYPKKGILFRDITTLIKDENAFEETINQIFYKIPTKIILWKIVMKFTFKIFDEKIVIDFVKYFRNFI